MGQNPLLTKRMGKSDYNPLLEKIRSKISTWTARYLSYAGRLQLIGSVIASITNFWMASFRLPKACIKEVESLCAAFLWSGPELNSRSSKMVWGDVCRPKEEGGLGLRRLSDVNLVCNLKLIWRILSSKDSLWVNWIQEYLIQQSSYWSVQYKQSSGSWMWRKLLKYRELAQPFHAIEVRSGAATSFWYDNWSPLGRLIDLTGARGVIDLGILINDTVASVFDNHRQRRHRNDILNSIEAVIHDQKLKRITGETDMVFWRRKNGEFKSKFLAKDVWDQIRNVEERNSWHAGIWFQHATPKFSFMAWLAAHNRLMTGDRMIQWNVGVSGDCVLCNQEIESRDHLFFSCEYTNQIWNNLSRGLLGHKYTSSWAALLQLASENNTSRIEAFLLRYVLQCTITYIWRERNGRRHGEPPSPPTRIIQLIDKEVRNRISTIRRVDTRYEEALVEWFAIRA